MKNEGKKWFEALRSFIDECRVDFAIAERTSLSPAEEVQCRIIGGSLIGWLQKFGPCLLQERAVLTTLQDWEKDPFIVFTSEQPGLVAANEILEESPPTIAFLYPGEFTRWTKSHPDED